MRAHIAYRTAIATSFVLVACRVGAPDGRSAREPSHLAAANVREGEPSLVSLPQFTVTTELSDRAAQRLVCAQETIVVSADFFGYPIAAARKLASPGLGELPVGQQRREMKAAGVAEFGNIPCDAATVRLLEGEDVKVLINVFSGRRSNEKNILDCDIFQDSVQLAAKEGVRIRCSLLEESFEREMRHIGFTLPYIEGELVRMGVAAPKGCPTSR